MSLTASITPIRSKRLNELGIIPKAVTNEQWSAYWGRNSKERLQKVMESLLVTYGGAWVAWLLSFSYGGVIAAFVGTFLIFNWIYTPWINAKNRNARLRPPGERMYYAIYTGEIKSLNKLRRRAGKTVGAVSQEFLQVVIEDELGRHLEIVTQWQDSYSKLRRKIKCSTLIASSTDKTFSSLDVVTDLWVPSLDLWLGDYPYLDRYRFKKFVRSSTSSVEGKGLDEAINGNDNNSDSKKVGLVVAFQGGNVESSLVNSGVKVDRHRDSADRNYSSPMKAGQRGSSVTVGSEQCHITAVRRESSFRMTEKDKLLEGGDISTLRSEDYNDVEVEEEFVVEWGDDEAKI